MELDEIEKRSKNLSKLVIELFHLNSVEPEIAINALLHTLIGGLFSMGLNRAGFLEMMDIVKQDYKHIFEEK